MAAAEDNIKDSDDTTCSSLLDNTDPLDVGKLLHGDSDSDDETCSSLLDNTPPLDVGKLLRGCEHYRRRCKIRAPCCNQIFFCRHCHNDSTGALTDPKERHQIVRQDIKQVICDICSTEQEVAHICTNCGVKMGEYFCRICKFYDDVITKQQFHCDDCGICRVGGRENYFHCQKCGSCYHIRLLDNHACVENSMKHHCPICYEFLFDSIKSVSIMKCGHTMHVDCADEMINQNQYRCPICSKSMGDMSATWRRIDEQVSILCNDCNNTSKVPFHIFGHKCSHCNSYNTRRIGTTDSS